MSTLCKRPNCSGRGTSHCSACLNEWYCSVECQRADWKEHKKTCSKKVASLRVHKTGETLLKSENKIKHFFNDELNVDSRPVPQERKGIKNFEEMLRNDERRFRDEPLNECFNDWSVFFWRDKLTAVYITHGTIASSDTALGYANESRSQLEMRRSIFEDRSNSDDLHLFHYYIFRANTHISNIFKNTMRNEEALYHTQEAQAAAKHCPDDYNGESDFWRCRIKTIKNTSDILTNDSGPVKYAEELYLLESGLHGPEHPKVLKQAAYLVDNYQRYERLIDAERFARINYECLIDPSNHADTETSITGRIQVASVWYRTPPGQRIGGKEAAEEAETLAREACDMLEDMQREDGSYTLWLLSSYTMLLKVMMERGKTNRVVIKTMLKALSFTEECKAGYVSLLDLSKRRYRLLRKLASLYIELTKEVEPDSSNINSIISTLKKAKCAFQESVIIGNALLNTDSPLESDGPLDSPERLKEVEYSLSMYRGLRDCWRASVKPGALHGALLPNLDRDREDVCLPAVTLL
jgi:MYND finger